MAGSEIGVRGGVGSTALCVVLLLIACVWTGPAAADATLAPLPAQPPTLAWPTEHWHEGPLPDGLDRNEFERALADLFSSKGRDGVPDTRAVLFVQDGRLVYERYAEGFDRSSRFQSWSIAKSLTNAFVGLLVGDGVLELDAPAPVEAWSGGDDPRAAITLRQLLQMRSGLANSDGFGDDLTEAFITALLFGEGSTSPAAFAADVRLVHPIGERWAYSTGTSTLVAAIAGRQVGDGPEDTMTFLRERLFDRVGMQSAVLEFAESGEFVGGAFAHANARDWARFGYLYLRDGVWDGERILPRGWVDFTRTPSPAANNGVYGAHFWVNRPPAKWQWEVLPGVPDSAFVAEGAMFQMIAILPSLDLVAVRLGEAHGADHMELRRRFARVIAAFSEVRPEDGAVGEAFATSTDQGVRP